MQNLFGDQNFKHQNLTNVVWWECGGNDVRNNNLASNKSYQFLWRKVENYMCNLLNGDQNRNTRQKVQYCFPKIIAICTNRKRIENDVNAI